jgi:polysaccharide biosynthesis PFTS motif protein
MTGAPAGFPAPATDAEQPQARQAERLLLVHDLNRRTLRNACRASASGADVACLTGDPHALARIGGAVTLLAPNALPDFERGAEVDGLFDLVDLVYDALCERSSIPARLRRIFRSDGVDYFFRRWLVREVGAFFSLALLVEQSELASYRVIDIERRWPNGPAYSLIAEVLASSSLEPTAEVSGGVARLRFSAGAGRGISWAKNAARTARTLAQLWLRPLMRMRPFAAPLPRVGLLLRTYPTDWGIDVGAQRRLRNLDFVVDDDIVRTADVGVWAEPGVSDAQCRALAGRGYPVLRESTLRTHPGAFVLRTLPRLVRLTPVCFRLLRWHRGLHAAVATLSAQYLLWSEVCRQARPSVLLAVNDISPAGVARNVALAAHGCLSVEYEFSSHWRADAADWVPDYVYAFTLLGAMATWGPRHSAFIERHRGRIAEYWDVGCLWSEHARVVAADPALRRLYADDIERRAGVQLDRFRNRVAVFDTSPSSMLSPDDLTAFYAGVLDLARELDDVLFVFKPKNPPDERIFPYSARGDEIRRALDSASNVVLLPNNFETAAVVGLTDGSISACFTSTVVEGLGCCKPAVYFDPTDRLPNAFWRSYPGLVCVDAAALENRIRELLTSDPAAFADFARREYADIEGHFDGLAITRLREHLRAAMQP